MSKLIKIVTEVLNYSISTINQKYNINTENLKHNIVTEVISGDFPGGIGTMIIGSKFKIG